jgi:selenocysteine lyase/cysteine desulfurase
MSHVRAATRFLTDLATTQPPTSLSEYERLGGEIRGLGAELLDCRPADIALLASTTAAMSIVPLGLDWRRGDEVVLYEREYPSVVYAWRELRRRGVRIRFVPDRDNRFELDELVGLISPRTRAVSVSLVNFVSGFRAPVEQIGRACRERGIWFQVDAVQAAGVIPVSVREIGADVVAAQGYKHLLAGRGVTLCFCSERARSELALAAPAWISTTDFTSVDGVLDHEAARFTSDARRFESAVPSFAALWGMTESLRLVLAAGPRRIESHVHGLLDVLVEELLAREYTIHTPLAPGERSSIVSVSPPGETDLQALAAKLEERRVAVSVRGDGLRISPHLYNDRDDVGRLLEALP